MAGAAGLEPVTSAVTGQRSNQLSYAPAWGSRTYEMTSDASSGTTGNVRAADANEVGVGNPAEETYCHPNTISVRHRIAFCQLVIGDESVTILTIEAQHARVCAFMPMRRSCKVGHQRRRLSGVPRKKRRDPRGL
jgi:hypothetical protein